jgi:hypothetical protein
MSYNFGEIIKKLYSLFQEAKPSCHSRLPPPPPRKLRRRIFHVVERNVPVAGAVFTRQIYSLVICESMPFDNGSSDWAQIQHEDGQWCSSPLLFRQDLPNSYWRPLASFCDFI